jgi:DNA adenine methylase
MGVKMKPMFKWSGGKRRELQHVQELAPDKFSTYCEPFVGGGAAWFRLSHDKNQIGDTNGDVINFYNVVKTHGKAFIDDLNSFALNYKQTIDTLSPKMREEYKPLADDYYHWRDGNHTGDYDLAKRFYILRNLAFGGMLRFNRAGKFNVPYGYYKNFKQLEWNSEYEDLFKNSTFECQAWSDTVTNMTGEDFVFLDPPYTREFTKYSADGDFGEQDHRELSEWFSSKSTKAMIILNKDDFTESLYSDFIKKEYEFSYGVRYRKDRLNKDDVTTYHFVATNY